MSAMARGAGLMRRELTPGKIMIFAIAVLVVFALAWLLIQIRSVIAMALVGVIFATAIEPLVNRLRRLGLPQIQAILVVYVFMIGLLTLLLMLIVPTLLSQGSSLIDDVPTILQELRRQADASPNNFINTTVWDALLRAERAWIQWRSSPPIEGQEAVRIVSSVGGAIFTIFTVLVVGFYWLSEKNTLRKIFIGLFSPKRQGTVTEIWDAIEFKIGGWIRGQLLLCLIIGSLSTTAYFFLDLRFWLALGIFAGITEAVPFIGPIVGGGAAVVVALTDSWQKAVIVLIFAVLIQQLESALLVPRVMRNAVGMSPLTVIFAVLIGSEAAGVLGAVLAIPVGAAVQVSLQIILRSKLHPELAMAVPGGFTSSAAPPARKFVVKRIERNGGPGNRPVYANNHHARDGADQAGDSSSAVEMASSSAAGSGDPASR
jgi:predicted PurR-regulated permease PerM